MPQYRHDYGQSEKEWSGDKEQIVKMVATHSRDMQKVSDGGQSPIGRLTHSGRNGSWRSFLEDCRLDRSFRPARSTRLTHFEPATSRTVRFARPNILFYDEHVIDLYRRICALYRMG
jgi:hypothetical protein